MTTKNKPQEPFLLFHPFSWKKEGRVALLLISIILILRFRAVFNISQGFIGGYEYDAGLYVWLVKSNLRDLFSEAWFNTKAFYPYGRSLAWSDNFIFPAITIGFLKLFGLKATTAYNILFFICFFLNAFLTYLCCYRLRGLRSVAIVPAIFILCYGFLSAHLGHPQLQFVFFFPLLVLAFFQFLDSNSRYYSFALGLIITIAFLTSAYIAVFLALTLFLLIVGFCILRFKKLNKTLISNFFIGIIISALPLLFFILPYLDVKSSFGARGLYEPASFALNGLSFVSPPSLSIVYTWLYFLTKNISQAETQVFPGIAMLFLIAGSFHRISDTEQFRKIALITISTIGAIIVLSLLSSFHFLLSFVTSLSLWFLVTVSIFWLHKLATAEAIAGVEHFTNRSFLALFLFVAVIFFVLAFGPLLNSPDSIGALTPFTIFYYGFPGISAIRAVGRFCIPLFFFLSIASCFSLPVFMKKLSYGKHLPAIFAAAILFENLQWTYPFEGITQRPQAFAALDQKFDKNTAVIALPFTEELRSDGQVQYWSDFSKKNVNYMHWNFPSQTYLVNGYSGMRSWLMKNFPRKLSGFPDQRSINALSQIPNLKYIILAPNFAATQGLNQSILSELVKDYHSLKKIQAYEDSYLIEFAPETPLKNKQDFLLRVPAKEPGRVTLSLKTEKKSDNPVHLRVYVDKYFQYQAYTELSITADQQWHELSFLTPETDERVVPYVLRFEPQAGNLVTLGARSFEAYQPQEVSVASKAAKNLGSTIRKVYCVFVPCVQR